MSRFRNVVCVGGAGFIGSRVVEQFKSLADSIKVIDNFRTGYRDRKELQDTEVLEQDIRRVGGDWVRAMRGADLVVHLAANQDIPWSAANMLEDFNINVMGTRNVVHACLTAGVSKLIFTCSAAIYGGKPLEELPSKEDEYPQPDTIYGKAKLQAEMEVLAAARVYGFNAHSLRVFSTYGPRESDVSMDEVRLFTLGIVRNKAVPVVGDPIEQARDYVHVEDVARAVTMAALDIKNGAFFYNVCSGRMTTFQELVSLMEAEIGQKPLLSIDKTRPSSKEWGSFDKARDLIGYVPQADLAEGIREMYDWASTAPDDVLSAYRMP